MTLLLGLDVGTSSAKAILFDVDSARLIAVASQEYPVLRPAPDRVEQDPETWWAAVVKATRQIVTEAGRDDVVAISFSGQMHGTILLDAANQPLHPAIIWADQRSAAECEELVAPLGAAAYAQLAGTLPATGFMGATLLWLAKHEPALLEKTHQVVFPKDYVRLKMTGRAATEVSDAASSGVFDIAGRKWAKPILQAVGLPETIFPEVLSSTAVAGTLLPTAAQEMGLQAGIPVVAGCADQPAQAIGNGLIRPGNASVTTGSGGQVFVPVQPTNTGIRTDPRLHVFIHAVPELYYVEGAILSAGLSLRWLREMTGLGGVPDAYPILSREAAAVAPGADGLLFLPYLSGERTPHMDPLARGAFIGLSSYHTRGHLARAVMEGVAFALRQALEISLSLGGTVGMVIAAGGGAESPVWRQIQADIFGVPMRQTLLTEQASIGAALLAGVGVGVYPGFASACAQVVQLGPETAPNTANQAFYQALFEQYSALYPRLKQDFHQLAHRRQ
ncbi:MAG: xylulokinase [Anaerolineaceae bacterium]|nr:xylulokinase [Anaerolineaceae bacterium]